MTDPDAVKHRDAFEGEQQAAFDAVMREMSSIESEIESIQNQLDHLSGESAGSDDLSVLESRVDALSKKLENRTGGDE